MDASTSNSSDTAWNNYGYVLFGPGTTNDTLYLWGYQVRATSIQTICRKLNATVIAYGNDTTESSVSSGTSDTTQSISIVQYRVDSNPAQIAPGCLGIAVVQEDSVNTPTVDYLVST